MIPNHQSRITYQASRITHLSASAYLLIEALVYIGLVFVVLGAAYLAMYRCIDNSVALRRSADDIATALHAGERWRADVRSARDHLRLETTAAGQFFYLDSARGPIGYHSTSNAVFRRLGDGPWLGLLTNVTSSAMQSDPRRIVTAWRWELELKPRAKGNVKPGRIRPLFTFIALPEKDSITR